MIQSLEVNSSAFDFGSFECWMIRCMIIIAGYAKRALFTRQSDEGEAKLYEMKVH